MKRLVCVWKRIYLTLLGGVLISRGTSINGVINISGEKVKHPTQKPIALFEYLIKTYTNKGDVVLDTCMGSGTTGVACKNLGRNFIGIEMDKKYFELAKERIEGTPHRFFG